MKKIFVFLFLIFFSSASIAQEPLKAALKMSDIEVFSLENKFGLKIKDGEVIVKPLYKKMIRLGNNSWIVQKGNRFGLIDSSGNYLVKPKYRHAERYWGSYVKLGNDSDYGLYDEYGNTIIPPDYLKIDPLFAKMFLTYKNYKYGIVDFQGKVILDNEYDDIYMPSPKLLRIQYEGEWYDIERMHEGEITLPENSTKISVEGNDIKITKVLSDTGLISGYSALTATDYMLKIFSSISPAYEETIDELMLSQGAETVSILIKLGWLPKFPFTYAKKYYHNFRTPNNGPLSEIRYNVKRQLKNR